jgi:hypothetical protein
MREEQRKYLPYLYITHYHTPMYFAYMKRVERGHGVELTTKVFFSIFTLDSQLRNGVSGCELEYESMWYVNLGECGDFGDVKGMVFICMCECVKVNFKPWA